MSVEVLKRKVEFMTERFQECMKLFDESNVSTKKLADDLSALNERMDASSKDADFLTDRISEILNKLAILKKDSSDQISSLLVSISAISSESPLIKNEISATQELFNGCNAKIDSVLSKMSAYTYADKSEVKPLYIEIDKVNKQLSELADSILIMSKSVNLIIQNLRQEISPLPGNIEVVNAQLDNHESRVVGLKNEIHDIKCEIKNLSKSLLDAISVSISTAIESIPKNESVCLDDVKKVIASSLEAASLDSKNANARSANNETKIMILEKKLESLNLALNKISLGT
jgi:chromosome segregation ATPase